MNTKGSYRKILEHSKQAIIAAIEIYNKPKFDYREEIFAMLLANAWELMFLAVLSKNGKRIFKPKKRNQDYKTLTFDDSMADIKPLFPPEISAEVVVENIVLIRQYRNTATHYYHEEQHKHAIYALAHASIKNYHDLCKAVFDQDIADEISIVLLPLSFNAPPDFVEFFKTKKQSNYTPFISNLFSTFQILENNSADTNRLITHCKIRFEPTKNINLADITASRGNVANSNVIERQINPNDSHPLLMKTIIGRNSEDKKRRILKHKNLNHDMNSNDFQAVIWKNKIKSKFDLCWDNRNGTTQYSPKIIAFLNGLSVNDIKKAKVEYNKHKRRRK